MDEIAAGLWRWAAPHSGWRPGAAPDSTGDWDQYVGSVLYVGRDVAVFIDPPVPRDEDQFWGWADERVAGRSVVVLTTLLPHRRSREQVAQRYGASTSRVKRDLPAGVESIVLRGARETMLWLPEHRTLSVSSMTQLTIPTLRSIMQPTIVELGWNARAFRTCTARSLRPSRSWASGGRCLSSATPSSA